MGGTPSGTNERHLMIRCRLHNTHKANNNHLAYIHIHTHTCTLAHTHTHTHTHTHRILTVLNLTPSVISPL